MSRWIDADKLKKDLSENYVFYGFRQLLNDFYEALDSAPSIDIVRCSECKHRKPSGYIGSIKTYECDITGFRMHELTNHFCSYGERSSK